MRSVAVLLLAGAVLVVAGVTLPTTADPGAEAADVDEDNLDAIRQLHATPPSNPGVGPIPSAYEAVRKAAERDRDFWQNPWGKPTVTVGVQTMGDEPSPRQRVAVEQTLEYWNDHSTLYTDYDVEFEYAPDTSRPDIAVLYVPHIEDCGGGERTAITLACAPRFDDGETTSVPTTVRVRQNRPLEDLRFSVKHEFGHLLGLQHGEGPMPLMAQRAPFEPRVSVRDATDRDNPWHDQILSVAVVQDGSYRQAALEGHVREALEFYDHDLSTIDGGSPDFRLTDDPSRADIVLRVTRSDECSVGGGYCWTVSGEQLDRDKALEYFTEFEATFGALEQPYLSWYTGRVIGFALGAEDESELPETFRDPYNAPDKWFDAGSPTHEPDDDDRQYSVPGSRLESKINAST